MRCCGGVYGRLAGRCVRLGLALAVLFSESLPLNPPQLRERDFDGLVVPLSSISRWQ